MKLPVLKKNNKYYIELPSEIQFSDSLELFELRDGHYLLTSSLGQLTKPEQTTKDGKIAKTDNQDSSKNPITLEQELEVVSKLLSLKFGERKPSNVSKILNAKEREILNSLIRKKHVSVFEGKKYKGNGVYNISNKLFSIWKEYRSKNPEKSASFLSTLQKEGYMLVSDENDAKRFSEEIKQQMALGQVLGIRGFDGRYYIATKNYYSKLKNLIQNKLKDSMSINSIAELCDAPNEACDIVLKLMSEEGEAIEKRKGVYSLV